MRHLRLRWLWISWGAELPRSPVIWLCIGGRKPLAELPKWRRHLFHLPTVRLRLWPPVPKLSKELVMRAPTDDEILDIFSRAMDEGVGLLDAPAGTMRSSGVHARLCGRGFKITDSQLAYRSLRSFIRPCRCVGST